jgi:type IV pilus assembly protein PilO
MGIQLSDPKAQRIALGSIVGIGVLYVYFLTTLVPFTYKASAAEIKDLSGRYDAVNRDLTKARQEVNSLPYLEKEFSLVHAKWQSAQSLLPDSEEMASLLRAVAMLGDQSGVVFVLFRPLPAQPAQYHTEHPIEVRVEGGYHEIGTFLGELANMQRIVTVSDLSIETAKDSPVEKPAAASFIAKTYTLGGTGVPPEEVKAKGEKKGRGGKQAATVKEVSKKLTSKSRGGESDE